MKKDGTNHFVVVYGISKNGIVQYMGPAHDTVQKKSEDEFYENFDDIMILAVPNENFVRSKEGARGLLTFFIDEDHVHIRWIQFRKSIFHMISKDS